jgi:uncharacterized lipoprotein YajG
MLTPFDNIGILKEIKKKHKHMKSLYILFTILFLAIATVSCGNKAKEEAAIVEEQATYCQWVALTVTVQDCRYPTGKHCIKR